ncbi:MAG TPA: RDD family protein [Candidatus Edwardsbacteria bacterium]|nr:RDD family protein [Candidatus Edwardsbacteria bacterium]
MKEKGERDESKDENQHQTCVAEGARLGTETPTHQDIIIFKNIMPTNFKMTPKSKRIRAFAFDLWFLCLTFLGVNTGFSVIHSEGNSHFLWDNFTVALIVFLLVFFDIYLIVSIWVYGQTLGAMKYGIKIVSDDGSKISLLQSWKRSMMMLGGSTFIFYLFMSDKRYTELNGRYPWDHFSKTHTIECE